VNRSVVILGVDSQSTYVVRDFLSASLELRGCIVEPPTPYARLIRRRFRRLGLTRVLGQCLFQALTVPGLRKRVADRTRQVLEGISGSLSRKVMSDLMFPVRSVNDSETIQRLREWKPRIVVVNGTRILSQTVLESTDAVFLNMHAGITPAYRGVHGGYWALTQCERHLCGVTVHVVDRGIDTGPVVGQQLISPTGEDNFCSYPWLQLAAGLPMMLATVEDLEDGKAISPVSPLAAKSKLWSHPTIWEYRRYRELHNVK
jgi:folate-dependent phosphoribosylglycinamide formyltransferase PurN